MPHQVNKFVWRLIIFFDCESYYLRRAVIKTIYYMLKFAFKIDRTDLTEANIKSLHENKEKYF